MTAAGRRSAVCTVVFVLSWGAPALAERMTTRDALDRLEGVLEVHLEDGVLDRVDVVPALVVSTQVRFEESKGWFATEALVVLTKVFGAGALRVCEACMAPRTLVREGYLEQSAGPIGLDEVIRLDASGGGSGEAARTAIWLDEHASGVALKIVDLRTARVIWAENVDPQQREARDTEELMKVSREQERRARGDSLTQVFVDATFFPGQHVSLDWTDQWGDTNSNFTGVTISLFDPIVGLGAAYYRAFDFGHLWGVHIAPQVGAKVILSIPTTIIRAVTGEEPDEVLDPIITGVGVLRLPFGDTNYGLVVTLSTNGRFGVGLSLLNVSLLPVIL